MVVGCGSILGRERILDRLRPGDTGQEICLLDQGYRGAFGSTYGRLRP
jgi:hypothetical protein